MVKKKDIEELKKILKSERITNKKIAAETGYTEGYVGMVFNHKRPMAEYMRSKIQEYIGIKLNSEIKCMVNRCEELMKKRDEAYKLLKAEEEKKKPKKKALKR